MLAWDNQQETSWFIGILEGEGSCRRDNGNRCNINIVNTNICIIKNCVDFLNRKTIFHTVDSNQPKNKKKIYRININEVNNCYTLIKFLGSSFQCRHQEFIDKLRLGSSTTTRDASITSDLYWLVGIFEAEGSLGLNIGYNQYYSPTIGIKNTNVKIIEKIVLTLKQLGLSWNINSEKHDNPQHKEIFHVRIRGMKRCQRFLSKMRNLWRSDYYNNRAELIEEFITARFLMQQKEPYSKRQHEIFQILKMKI